MASLVLFAATASAQTYVGSFKVNDGPDWNLPTTPVYSALEAAALLFGGAPTDYAVSIDPSTTNPATITHTAHYDGWGETCSIQAETERVDQDPVGYQLPGGTGSARSAYVSDHGCDGVNYVWRIKAAVPPTPVPTLGVFGLMSLGALIGVLGFRRTRKSV
ncbi:hypothetical protein [Comamonas piscis]